MNLFYFLNITEAYISVRTANIDYFPSHCRLLFPLLSCKEIYRLTQVAIQSFNLRPFQTSCTPSIKNITCLWIKIGFVSGRLVRHLSVSKQTVKIQISKLSKSRFEI